MRIFLSALITAFIVWVNVTYAVELQGKPWLYNLENRAVCIGFVTDVEAACGVRYRVEGAENWEDNFCHFQGQKIFSRLHNVHLAGLEAGKDYEFQVIATGNKEPSAVELCGYAGKFTTPGSGEYNFLILSDLQMADQRNAEVIANLYNAAPGKIDAVVLLGDMGNFIDDAQNDVLERYIQPLNKLSGGLIPLIPVRGNHEWRGENSKQFGRIFATFQGQSYFHLTIGNSSFTVLDCGEDKKDISPNAPYTNFNVSRQFRAEQRIFVEKLAESKEFINADFRIVFAHAAPFILNNSFISEAMRQLAEPLWQNDSAPITIWFGGHEHFYVRNTPGSAEYTGHIFTAKNLERKRPNTNKFVVVNNDGPDNYPNCTAIYLTVSPDQIHVQSFNEKAEVFDDFTIDKTHGVINLKQNAVFTAP